ncbi:4a-hydroxytetrahydrobiopterin dehydratase [Methanobacterium alkalithermotolerans]|uniref:4a-hydroxytetrahydrobiopterin dehydratase n=1 Tax=Methanobacterium alkalithermotolerans TaxID=2731220 RepID=A0A8T8K6S4_9EURY|nr:4a-hydroxytetrahydrobiopterin dehydratase [Methanobacterium alkalithermotolerans]QUH24348.1 4a-hydroxytetrahydrobiopterin dehydratase [Methanobacterium alkalithermotolerans]RJS48285.1 MAG: 4a-hydroxytetrahydrobiopterin dehydratase [Methanobacterium sp.]
MKIPQLLSLDEIHKRASTLDNWKVLEDHHLEGVFIFPDFASGMNFAVKVGNIAEKMQHHPEMEIGAGVVKLTIYTHDRDGLTSWDFDFAKKVNQLMI